MKHEVQYWTQGPVLVCYSMIIVCSNCGKSLTRNSKLDTFSELFTNFHAVTAMALCSLTFSWMPRDCRDDLQKPLRKTIAAWIILFLCQPSVELLYNICVCVAHVNRHDKQICIPTSVGSTIIFFRNSKEYTIHCIQKGSIPIYLITPQ